jgi:hypothetical protein
MMFTHTEQIVIDVLRSTGPCCLDDLVKSTPTLTWGQVFAAVDQMSRDGRIWLRQVGFSSYEITPHPQLFTPSFQVPRVGNFHVGESQYSAD